MGLSKVDLESMSTLKWIVELEKLEIGDFFLCNFYQGGCV